MNRTTDASRRADESIHLMRDIERTNPGWHFQIQQFVAEHPEFCPLLRIVASDEYTRGFNMNPDENTPEAPRNVFESLLFGISNADLDADEALRVFRAIMSHLASVKLYEQTADNSPDAPVLLQIAFPPEHVRASKGTICADFINALISHGVAPARMTIDDLHIAETVPGVTKNAISLMYMLYAARDDERVIPYRDINFRSGMEILYGWQHASTDQIMNVTRTWRNKKVGVMFIIQLVYFHTRIFSKDAEGEN